MTSTDVSDDELRKAAISRIARVFRVSSESLRPNTVFGEDLKEGFVSQFKANEFDQIDYDIRDVASRQILEEMGSGKLVIKTVDDYCEHMIRCYRIKPKDVIQVLAR